VKIIVNKTNQDKNLLFAIITSPLQIPFDLLILIWAASNSLLFSEEVLGQKTCNMNTPFSFFVVYSFCAKKILFTRERDVCRERLQEFNQRNEILRGGAAAKVLEIAAKYPSFSWFRGYTRKKPSRSGDTSAAGSCCRLIAGPPRPAFLSRF